MKLKKIPVPPKTFTRFFKRFSKTTKIRAISENVLAVPSKYFYLREI